MLALKEEVYKANLALVHRHLALFTWGNASAIDRNRGLMVIKPHNVSFDDLRPGDMVVMDLDGRVVDGKLAPSYDAATHLLLYKHFEKIGGIVHSHSTWATSWAQAGKSIPTFGTTHADCFAGEIPCTRLIKDEEINDQYEHETARVIIETFKNLDPIKTPAVLVRNHGPYVWGETLDKALLHATVLEEVARLAMQCLQINPDAVEISTKLQQKHYHRNAVRVPKFHNK